MTSTASAPRTVLDAISTDATVREERTPRIVNDLDDDGARATCSRSGTKAARG